MLYSRAIGSVLSARGGWVIYDSQSCVVLALAPVTTLNGALYCLPSSPSSPLVPCLSCLPVCGLFRLLAHDPLSSIICERKHCCLRDVDGQADRLIVGRFMQSV